MLCFSDFVIIAARHLHFHFHFFVVVLIMRTSLLVSWLRVLNVGRLMQVIPVIDIVEFDVLGLVLPLLGAPILPVPLVLEGLQAIT